MAGGVALSCANLGAKIAWIPPTYKNGRPLWRFAEQAISQAPRHAVEKNISDRVITFPRTGGFLGIYSGDNDVGIRGENFDGVIVEEASQIKAETFYDVILPTLADNDGFCYLIFTPKGRGHWTYAEAVKAQLDATDYSAFWTAPSSDNPNPRIKKAYELAKTRVPLRTFRQEWNAEFVEGEGSVFSQINQVCSVKPYSIEPYAGRFVAGLDFAQQNDFTVMVVLDASTSRQVDMLRVNKEPWRLIRERIIKMCDKWGINQIVGEKNSIGQPNIEALQEARIPIQPFDTTSVSKAPLIESLILAFEQGEIELFDDPIMRLEFEAYEKSVNPITGRTTYSAPESSGQSENDIHDDIVMATALAFHAITSNNMVSIIDSYKRRYQTMQQEGKATA